MFAKHHYLAHSHNNSARVFIALVNGEIAAFCSVLAFPHPRVKNVYRVHRLVVLPDYQGVGVGLELQRNVADYYVCELGYRLTLTTSNPAMVHGLKKQRNWVCTRIGRASNIGHSAIVRNVSANRITTSWEYKKIE